MKVHLGSFRSTPFWTILLLAVGVASQQATTASKSLRLGQHDPAHRQRSLFGDRNDAEAPRADAFALEGDGEEDFVSLAFVFIVPWSWCFVRSKAALESDPSFHPLPSLCSGSSRITTQQTQQQQQHQLQRQQQHQS